MKFLSQCARLILSLTNFGKKASPGVQGIGIGLNHFFWVMKTGCFGCGHSNFLRFLLGSWVRKISKNKIIPRWRNICTHHCNILAKSTDSDCGW